MFLHVCMHVRVHQLMHKGKRARSSKVGAWAGHCVVCFVPHKLQVDLVRNCGCSSRNEGKQMVGRVEVTTKCFDFFQRKII